MSRRRAELRHPDRLPTRDVVVGYCRPDSIDGAFSECLAALMEHDMLHTQRILKRVYIESGPRIAPARNRIVAQMLLDPAARWLLMLDVDMTFTPDLLDRFLDHANPADVPILGALTFGGGRDFRIAPMIFAANPAAQPGELNLQIHYDYPEDTLVKCHGTGAACLLIHRTVLEALYTKYRRTTVYPFFAETEIAPITFNGVDYDGTDIGEDITFCLRAVNLGFPIHVHTGIKTGHRKKITLDENTYRENRRHIEAVGEHEARRLAREKIGVVG